MAAEVGGGDGKRRPRIDMTPMVDLGFLLLTFFVLTTTMGTPMAMQITVPADKPIDEGIKPPPLPCQRVLTLLVTGENRVYHYQCKESVDDNELNVIGYGGGQIRNLVKERQASTLRNPHLQRFEERDLVVMIKLSEDATYKNMVDMLDEMKITKQGKYMLVNMSPEEVDLVKAYEESKGLSNSIPKTIEIIGLPGANNNRNRQG